MKDEKRIRALTGIGISMMILGVFAMIRGSSTAAIACFSSAGSTINAANVIRHRNKKERTE